MERMRHVSISPEVIDPHEIERAALNALFTFEQQQYYIDHGGAGKVYQLPQGFCIKILESRHNSPNKDLMKLGNSVLQESRFLERISHMEFSGNTRTPRYVGHIRSDAPDSKNAIIMERLAAINLQHVLNKTAELPPKFEIHAFFEDLERFIQTMHEREGLVHNDLYARNIMIDTETAMPRVIDFGLTVDANRGVRDQRTREQLEEKDWTCLEQAYNELAALQK